MGTVLFVLYLLGMLWVVYDLLFLTDEKEDPLIVVLATLIWPALIVIYFIQRYK